jgi:hypothetical protein
MAVFAWIAIAIIAVAAMVLVLANPGLWLVAMVGLGVVLVAAILMLIRRGQADIDAMDEPGRRRSR